MHCSLEPTRDALIICDTKCAKCLCWGVFRCKVMNKLMPERNFVLVSVSFGTMCYGILSHWSLQHRNIISILLKEEDKTKEKKTSKNVEPKQVHYWIRQLIKKRDCQYVMVICSYNSTIDRKQLTDTTSR